MKLSKAAAELLAALRSGVVVYRCGGTPWMTWSGEGPVTVIDFQAVKELNAAGLIYSKTFSGDRDEIGLTSAGYVAKLAAERRAQRTRDRAAEAFALLERVVAVVGRRDDFDDSAADAIVADARKLLAEIEGDV